MAEDKRQSVASSQLPEVGFPSRAVLTYLHDSDANDHDESPKSPPITRRSPAAEYQPYQTSPPLFSSSPSPSGSRRRRIPSRSTGQLPATTSASIKSVPRDPFARARKIWPYWGVLERPGSKTMLCRHRRTLFCEQIHSWKNPLSLDSPAHNTYKEFLGVTPIESATASTAVVKLGRHLFDSCAEESEGWEHLQGS